MRKRYIEILTILLVVIISTIIIKKYFTPFMYIVVFYLVVKPLSVFINKSIGSKRVSTALSIFIVNVIFIALFIYIGNGLYSILNKKMIFYIDQMDKLLKGFLGIFHINPNLINGEKAGGNIFNSEVIRKGALYTSENLVSYIISFIAIYFLIVDKEYFKKELSFFLPNRILHKIKITITKIKDILFVEVKLVLITTIVTFLGLTILRVPNSFMISIICGMLDIMPYVGTIIVFIPLIIYNIVLKEYFVAIGLIFLYILEIVVREILETKYIGNELDVHPLISLIAIYIGFQVFGILGLFSGPIFILLVKNIVIENA